MHLPFLIGILVLTTQSVLADQTKSDQINADQLTSESNKDDLFAEASEDLPVAEALVQETPEGTKANRVQFDVSPAEELRQAAKQAGYNISDDTLQLAASGTDEELTDSLPPPLAQALIDRRRRPDLRDRLIGMTFLGQPVPLDYRQRKRPFMLSGERPVENRRRLRVDVPRRQLGRLPNELLAGLETTSGGGILKPLVLSGTRTSILFPEFPSLPTSKPRKRPQQIRIQVPITDLQGGKRPKRIFPAGDGSHFRDHRIRKPPFRINNERIRKPSFSQKPDNPPYFEISGNRPNSDNRRPLKRFPVNVNFGNSVGPDFGPVQLDIDHNLHEDNIEGPIGYMTFDSSNIPPPDGPFPPHLTAESSQSGVPFSIRQRPLSPFKPSKPFAPSNGFTNFGGLPEPQNSVFSHTLPRDSKSQCNKYTETICLDADNYPHAAILDALEGDKSRTDGLIAEVRDQSADDLVDGVSARQEERYDYSHYFGGNTNRREDTEPHRDFADDGGYLCPSEVKYARPKRAKNSKGEWKFVVNMEKYTQTIRMEKCLQPGGSCSYVSHHYKAMCNQVHNYQRLLVWEKKRGLHMDIFKVPSCCTCHIQGYSFAFPPLNDKKNNVAPTKRGNRLHSEGPPRQALAPPPKFNQPHDTRRLPGLPPQSTRRPSSPFGNFIRSKRPRPVAPLLNNEIRRFDTDVMDQFRLEMQRGRMPLNNQRHRTVNQQPLEDDDFRKRTFDGPGRRIESRGTTGRSRVEADGPTGRGRMERGPPFAPDSSRMDQETEASDEYVTFTTSRQPGKIGKRQINYNYHPISQFFSDYN